MKSITSLLLLLAAGTCLFQFTLAGVSAVPLDVLENLKISDDLPEAPVEVEQELFERNIYADIVAELPEQQNVLAEERAAGRFIFL